VAAKARRLRTIRVRAERALTFLALLALGACKRAEPASVEATAPPSAAPEAPKPAAPASEFHEDTFDLSLRAVGPYSVGKPASAEVVLSPKGGYHTNEKYPYKFKAASADGVTYRTAVFTKDDVKLDEKQATMKVDFTPDSAGSKTVSGQFAFSVCSAERCLVEKRDLTLNVAVN
jgi:hypothetical protein